MGCSSLATALCEAFRSEVIRAGGFFTSAKEFERHDAIGTSYLDTNVNYTVLVVGSAVVTCAWALMARLQGIVLGVVPVRVVWEDRSARQHSHVAEHSLSKRSMHGP